MQASGSKGTNLSMATNLEIIRSPSQSFVWHVGFWTWKIVKGMFRQTGAHLPPPLCLPWYCH